MNIELLAVEEFVGAQTLVHFVNAFRIAFDDPLAPVNVVMDRGI